MYSALSTGLVKAAFDFNLRFATSFEVDVAIGSGEGGEGGGEDEEDEDGGEDVDGEGGGEGGSSSAAAAVVVEEEDSEDGGALVDDEWKRVPGGPFTARLMTKSRQPVSTAIYRNYGVAVPIDPINGPLSPGCDIKFPVVAGAPAEGIICPLPRSWGADTHALIFKLKLSKAGATEDTVTIASALYREPRVDVDEGEDEAAAHEPPLHPSPIHPVEEVAEDEPEVEAEAAAATVAAARAAAQAAAAAAEAMDEEEEEEEEEGGGCRGDG